ncbi:MAG: hypothetical protein GEU90_21000 [Gemmatimonas sp.]|nr:hypothetical protein [Gemmatimonas sp.]
MPETQVQLTNKTYIQWGGQQVTLGTDNVFTTYDIFIQDRQNGLFEFDSLEDLENMNPYRYVRDAPKGSLTPYVKQDVLDLSLFAQTEFNALPRLSTVLGLRYDVTMFLREADYNPLLDETFGIRTDRPIPIDWTHLQPRVQLTWDIRGDRSEVLRAGGGAFMGQPHHAPFYNVVMASGVNFAEIILNDEEIPTPDFDSYRSDPTTIPGVPEGASTAPTPVELISPDYRAPRTWKFNVAYQRRVLDYLTLGANLLYSRTTNNYHYFLRNLVEEPYFTLANEQDRPVFVPPETVTEEGRTNPLDSRISDEVGTIEELVSEGGLRQKALILDAQVDLPQGSSLGMSYTWNDTRDNSNYQCCLSQTAQGTPIAGDPRELQWGQSLWTFRHKLSIYGSLPPIYGFRISGRYVGQSGSPYSLMVAGDINGDGNMLGNNDLAFVFDPDDPSTPPEIAETMRRVLDDPDNLARDYIRDNLGRIAERNGGASPWSGRIDLRVSRSLPTVRGQSVELVADIFNLANLLNSEWGGRYNLGGKRTLLNVRGFDQESSEYIYEVNENVGTVRMSGDPYQIQVGLRYAF